MTVHDADSGEPIWETFSFKSLKEAISKFLELDRAGELEYGLSDIKLKTDIVKEKKMLKPVKPNKKPGNDIYNPEEYR